MVMQRRPESWVISGYQRMTTDVCVSNVDLSQTVGYLYQLRLCWSRQRVDLECWNWHRTNGSTDESLVEAPVESELGKDY
jgi:hypothetical protein